MKLDVLAIGAHPDDVELSCSGVLLVEKKNGKKVGIADLTQGELGTRGTAETRKQEATDAAAILGLDIRVNIGLRDGFFQNNEADQLEVIKIIRKFKPEIVLCNAPSDRHPDHGKGASLVRDACFLSGLRKIKTAFEGVDQEAWRPKYVLNYIQDRFLQPNFVIDISDVMQTKLEAIKAYGTQFNSTDNSEPQTYISTPNFLDSIIYRSKMMGKMIGVQFAEGFISEKMIGLKSLDSLIKENT
ncbi:MAG TPA: bacillithiol biosynthesis deacetylase BshB1 [Ferruginibacter sp.]|nr:bacillithiol biosynthesis deacetylase BshB1 [Ferruginibacter sp.]HRE64193.1 bacillithiol biosynthesis deacetylase BshB1 [Ferruginibacter sp.]